MDRVGICYCPRGKMQIPPDRTAPPKLRLCIRHFRSRLGCSMGSETVLKGCPILIVEDDPLIRSELTDLFESAGAHIVAARTCEEAAAAILQRQICAALLDYGLRGDNVAQLGKLLSEYQIPYMFYTGYSDLQQIYPHATIVEKPASGKVLLDAMAALVVSGPLNRVGCVAKGGHQSANVKSPARHSVRLQR